MGAKNMVRTTFSVAGVPMGEALTFSGGEHDMTERKRAAGAGKRRRAKRGKPTTGNVVITIEDDGRLIGNRPLLDWLTDQRGAAMVVQRQPLDDTGNPQGPAHAPYTGKLKRVTPGEGDVEDEDADDIIELEQLTDDR